MTNAKKITNPCNECLVQPCCTDICDSKYTYTNNILEKLYYAGQKIYHETNKTKIVNPNKKDEEIWEQLITLCRINKNEIDSITHHRWG